MEQKLAENVERAEPVKNIENRYGKVSDVLMILLRILIIAVVAGLFIPYINPVRLSGAISKNASLFTCAFSYSAIGSNFVRALYKGWIDQGTLTTTYIGALIDGIAAAALAAAACMSLGESRLRRLGTWISICASAVGIAGTVLLRLTFNGFAVTDHPNKIKPMLPTGIYVYGTLFTVVFLLSVAALLTMPKPPPGARYEMQPKYRLFLMILPFIILVVVFSYLPLYGWRYAFFDYKPGSDLTSENFVGFKWLRYLFGNAATRADIVRVLKNTFAMSGIGIVTSWLPMAFAIFLTEIPSNRTKRLIQTFTTIPNFISWVLVYTVAFAFFSTEGFMNSVLINLGVKQKGTNYLMSGDHIWLKMWLWGTWKGLGWGSIIYISSISNIDPQLYEAATVDGAGRFKKMWHVTVPGLLPTFFVMLLMSIANILSNGMDQYLVFYNAANRKTIQVLDLYVYQLGLASSSTNIPLATLIGMLKSLVSVTLLFTANRISGRIRGQSII